MRWTRRTGPSDVEDRRGARPARAGLRLGLGGVFVLLLLSVVFNQDFISLLGSGDAVMPGGGEATATTSAEEDRIAQFVEFVVGDAQDAWSEVRPESFTHGSAADRTAWFRRGLESGQPNVCDTFGGRL